MNKWQKWHIIILYFAQLALSLQSGSEPKCRSAPFFWKKIKRLLIIRMFEKLGGGKDIVIENNGGRSRYAWTVRYISLQ